MSLKWHPDQFLECFGMTVEEFKVEPDQDQLRDNMLANPNNYIEEFYEDLFEEGEIHSTPLLQPIPPKPIARPQIANKKKLKKFEPSTCMNCKKPHYNHILWCMGRQEDYEACRCKGRPHLQAPTRVPTPPLKKPSPTSSTASLMPSLQALTTTTELSAPYTLHTLTPPSYATITKETPQEKRPLPTPEKNPSLTPNKRCQVLNDRILGLLQQHREAAQKLEQKFHTVVEDSIAGKLASEAYVTHIDNQISECVNDRLINDRTLPITIVHGIRRPTFGHPPRNTSTPTLTKRPSYKIPPTFKTKNDRLKCHYCNENGHFKRNCQKFVCSYCQHSAPRHIPSQSSKYVCTYYHTISPRHFSKDCPQQQEDKDFERYRDYDNGLGINYTWD